MSVITPNNFQDFIDVKEAQITEEQDKFNAVDGNTRDPLGAKDGVVSEAEFTKHAKEQGLSDEQAATLFNNHSGEDGVMDIAEFTAADTTIGMYLGAQHISND